MGWIVVVSVLALPFVLLRFDRHGAARIALLAYWMGCLGGATCFFAETRNILKDLDKVDSYPLSVESGTHHLTIAPLSQRSMKGVLTGGAAELPGTELKQLKWRFTDKFVRATWHEPKIHDGPSPGETLLFYVEWGGPDGPLNLEYQVGEGTGGLLRGRSLSVTHDAGARHMLGHAWFAVHSLAWGLLILGVAWMITQIACEATRRKKNASGPAGTEAFL